MSQLIEKGFVRLIFRDGGQQIEINGGMVLPAEVEELIASLRCQIAALQAEVADLRRQLGQDSSNSSKPPSSDGLKKKHRLAGSPRGASGKASGGQRGHKGSTLRQVGNPDCVIGHMGRAPAAIAVRRSVRSRRSGSTSGRCSILPSARSWSRNIGRRSTVAPVAAARRKRRFRMA